MNNIIADYWNMINDSHHLLINVYPEIYDHQPSSSLLLFFLQSYWKLFVLNNYCLSEIISIILGITIISIGRKLLLINIVDKLLQRRLLLRQDYNKFAIYSWEFLFFTMTVIISGKIVLIDNQWLQQPELFWTDLSIDNNHHKQMATMIKFLYIMDISNYIHSAFIIIFKEKTWNRDSPLLIIHHIIACLLLITSYMIRSYRIGVAMIFLMETNEIFYFIRCIIKLQFTIIQKYSNQLRLIGFSLLTCSWFLNRLYLYPLILIKSAIEFGSTIECKQSPWLIIYVFIYYLMIIILCFNIYWSIILINSIIHIYRNGLTRIEDIREYDYNCNDNNNDLDDDDVDDDIKNKNK